MRLVEVNKQLTNLYVEYHMKLIKDHKDKADELGIVIVDDVCNNYTRERSLSHLEHYKCYIVFDNNNQHVGIVTYRNLDETKGIFIECLYIESKYRRLGHATSVINYLKREYGKVQLDCWYNLEANKLYKNLGFKELYRRLEL